MLLSTLPSIPYKDCKPIGIVYCATIAGDKQLKEAFGKIEKQATDMNADAVVDIKVSHAGEGHSAIITGTAVRF